jgi:hypothetical protein
LRENPVSPDRPLGDIFALQDEITLSVVGAIEPSLRQAEIERAKRHIAQPRREYRSPFQ